MNNSVNLLDHPEWLAVLNSGAVESIPEHVREAFIEWAQAKKRLSAGGSSFSGLAEDLRRAAERLCDALCPRRTGPTMREVQTLLKETLDGRRAECVPNRLVEKMKPFVDKLCSGFPDTAEYVYAELVETAAAWNDQEFWMDGSGLGRADKVLFSFATVESPLGQVLRTENEAQTTGYFDHVVQEAIRTIRMDAYGEQRLASDLPANSPSGAWIVLAIGIAIFVIGGCSSVFGFMADDTNYAACIFSGGLSIFLGFGPHDRSMPITTWVSGI